MNTRDQHQIFEQIAAHEEIVTTTGLDDFLDLQSTDLIDQNVSVTNDHQNIANSSQYLVGNEQNVQSNELDQNNNDISRTGEAHTVENGLKSGTLKNELFTGHSKAREPDLDAIKMFVGQIPRTWNEMECKTLFEEFGDIYNIKVLRDRDAKYSKGCCFVTFYERRSALKAQDALHNIRVLPGMHHAIQMRPADSENLHERKLYVSSLNKNWNEQEIRDLFKAYGNVEDVNVLKDSTGQSKGNAFVIFATKSSAYAAIKALNQKKTLEGCNSPLIVRIAENQKERDARRQMLYLQQVGHLSNGQSTTPIPNTMFPAIANPLFNVNYLNGLNSLAYASLANSASSNQSNALTNSMSAMANNQLNSTQLPAEPTLLISNTTGGQKAHTQNACSTITSTDAATTLNKSTINPQTQMVSQFYGQHQSNQLTHHLVNLKNIFGLDQTTSVYPYPTAAVVQSAAPYLSNSDGSNLIKPLANLQQTTLHASTGKQPPKYNGSNVFSNILTTSTIACAPGNNQIAQSYLSSDNNYQQLLNSAQNIKSSNVTTNPSIVFQHQRHQVPNQANTLGNLLLNTSNQSANNNGNKRKQLEGPEGANLFIYHLPSEFTDLQLIEAFSPFGNILSCKVYIDKVTKLSKCFGFVSYDNAASAQSAIQAMNGFHVLNKRLKVQLKLTKKPYDRPSAGSK